MTAARQLRPAVAVKSFFRVVTTAAARERIAAVRPVGTEVVAVKDGLGRVLARDLAAAIDLPHFHRANMDGYAVRAPDTFGASASIPAYLRLVGVVCIPANAEGLEAGTEVEVILL